MFTRYNNLPFVVILIAAFLTGLPTKGIAETLTRSSWYIGFGFGGGLDARYTLNGKDITFDDWMQGAEKKGDKIAINFKVGQTLSPKTLLGFDVTIVGQPGEFGGGKNVQIQINNYFLMLTHFPKEEGFFIRVGGGLSNIMFKGIDGVNDGISGYGISGGVGYAFWLGQRFNLTLNLDHSRQFYSGGNIYPNNSQYTAVFVGFDWY